MDFEFFNDIPYLSYEHIEKKCKNIVFIHDAFEHIDRYEHFAKYFYDKGFNVYVLELNGHGKLQTKEVSDFGEGGLEKIIENIDNFLLFKFNKLNHNDLILFGHGLGSLIVSDLAIRKDYKNLILSALPFEKTISINLLLLKTMIEDQFDLNESSLNSYRTLYNKNFKEEGKYAYLTRDKEELKKYEKDINCGFNAKPIYFYEQLKLMKKVKKSLNKIREDANVLIIFGSEDYSINQEKAKKYMVKINNKIRNIKLIKNEGGRHDNLHEINKFKIYDELIMWINKLK
ncbi:serine aminopeptidase domain-containing protein [Oceanivirga salmonicida]|uniref:serine aminopeptidase domain-containing protein n=1 Tax=Oceanivirga salmonicida TaxID=1769291 RepID=UPI000829760A|nr:alpha/beta hydrolase [Oceanivirga salmonicida]